MTRSSLFLVVLLVSIGSWTFATARTWYVAADGSGDAPTITAAVESTTTGDVILVGPGTFELAEDIILKPGTSLESEAGPDATFLRSSLFHTVIVAAYDMCRVSGFHVCAIATEYPVYVLGSNVEVDHNIIEASVFGSVVVQGAGTIHNNVLFGVAGSGIYMATCSGDTYVVDNIILNGIRYEAGCAGAVTAACNLTNEDPNSDPYILFNFNGDPEFCGVNNYYLQSDSPCAPGNHPDGADCGLIGPLPIGCGAVSVREKTWGAVKALYRR